jgi:vitamin B12 transporter
MLKKIRWMAVVLLTGLVMYPLPLMADHQGAGQNSTLVLEPTVVTAGRIKEKKSDITTNATIYTREDLEASSIQDLSDLMLKEGFMVREYPNSTISVAIRGFSTDTHGNDLSSSVLILVNGRRAGTGNLAKISMDNVERVEIIRGPASVQYGASALGGVINVITRKGKGPFTAFLEGTLGSWDYKKGTVSMSGAVSQFDFDVTGSKSSQGDYDTGSGSEYRNTGFDSKERFSFNGGFTFLPQNRVGISYSDYSGDHIGSPDYLSANDPDDYVNHGIKSYDVYYDGQTRDDFLFWNIRYFKGKDEYETHDGAMTPSRTYWRDTDSQGAQAQITARWAVAQITAGWDWVDYEVSNSNTVAGKENTYENPAGFFMVKTKLLEDKLVLTGGGRYDEYEVTSDTGKVKEDDNWSFSCGAVYKITGELSVRANYAQAFKMPTADQLFMLTDYSAWGMGIWSGNENLKPESSETYEAGIDYTRGSLTGSLTYFHTDFEDRIAYKSIGGGVTQYTNVQGGTLDGVEGSLQLDIGAMFGWDWEIVPYGSFTTFLEYEDDETNEKFQYTPEWSAAYGMRVNHVEYGLNARLNFTHYGRHEITDYEGTGATTLGPDTVADFSVGKELFDMNKFGKIRLKGEINNLFDRDYALVQGYPSPGRTFYLGLNYTY